MLNKITLLEEVILMRFKLFFLILAAAIFLTGCATQQMDLADGVPDGARAEHEEWQNFFIFGLAPVRQRVQAENYCPGGTIGRVETELTFLNGLLHAVTYGLYSPYTMRVYCLP